jgi:cytochrome P450
MEVSTNSIAILGFATLALFWAYRILNFIWFKPKKLEKIMRDQGLKGNPYSIFNGDQKESENMYKEAMSKPISLDDDYRKRTVPHILKCFEKHGKESFMWVGRTPRVMIRDPELVKEVFTKNYRYHTSLKELDPLAKLLFSGIGTLNGDAWSKRRKIVKSAFHFEKIKLMLPAFYVSCVDMADKWSKIVPNGGSAAEVEVFHDIKALTGDVISRTLFGSSFEEGKMIFELVEELHVMTVDRMRVIYIPGSRFLPTKMNKKIKEIDHEVQTMARGIIDKKLKAINMGQGASDDLLGVLLQANLDEIKDQGVACGMTLEEVIGECRLFYFAGQDTTSTLLVWTMIMLGRYPEWQERARKEVFEVFGDRKPTYDGLSRLKVVMMILLEVLRMHTPVPEITKIVTEDTHLGKYFLPENTQVMMPQSVIHYDKDLWGEDAFEFKPERFADGILKAAKHQGAFFPFGLGPRMCLGQNFAFLETKMAFAVILPRFSFQLSPSYVHAPHTLITVQPQYGAHLIMHKIRDD